MKIFLGVVIGAIAAYLFLGGSIAFPTRQQPQVVYQQPSAQQVAQQPVQQQPVQPITYEQPVSQPGRVTLPAVADWQCPVAPEGGACVVPGTTDLVAGLCVDYDPRSTGIEGSFEVVKQTDVWARARITGQATYVGQYRATVYKDASCPAF